MNNTEHSRTLLAPNTNSVLLNGFPKSGNYLVWKILYLIQSHFKIYQSYIRSYRLSPGLTADGKQKDFIFKHADIIDGITLNQQQIGYDLTWQSYGAPMQVDPRVLFHNSSLLWCHDALTAEKFDVLSANIAHLVYVYRDVESVLKSFALHSLRFQQFNPKYSLRHPQDVIDNEKFIINNAKRWQRHVQYYLANEEKMHLINYSELTNNKADVIAKLISAIAPENSSLSTQQEQLLIKQIAEQTSISVMQSESKDHVNTQSSSLVISAANKALIAQITGQTREKIGVN